MYSSKILKNFGLMRSNLNRPITDLSVSEQILKYRCQSFTQLSKRLELFFQKKLLRKFLI